MKVLIRFNHPAGYPAAYPDVKRYATYILRLAASPPRVAAGVGQHVAQCVGGLGSG